jgi:uncharacterized protein YjiS (DUF1127 family)
MSINEVTSFDTRRHAVVPRLLGILRQFIASYLAYRQQLADIATLRSMSDRELKDFGVYRGDLDRIADEARREAIDHALRARSVNAVL